MPMLREKHATAFVFTLINRHAKLFMAAALVVVGFCVAAAAVYVALSDTRSYTEQIQTSREQFFLQNCRETNARHDKALNTLNAVILALPEGPSKDRILADRPVRVAVIEQLVPKLDCARYLMRVRVRP